MKKFLVAVLIVITALGSVFAQGASETKGDVEIEFLQWWDPELPEGFLRSLLDEFEAQNPGIKVKLVSVPSASYYEQIVSGAATGTLSDVVGVDGKWIYDVSKMGALGSIQKYLDASSVKSELTNIYSVDNDAKSVPVVSFVYPLFVNMDLLNAAGYTEPPKTREEFAEMAKACTDASKSQYGWVLPMPIQSSTGVRIETMTLYWGSGYKMIENGQPNLTNPNFIKTLEFEKDLLDAGAISPGALSKKEQDKVEEFANNRAAFMFNSLACINTLTNRAPNLNYVITDVPAEEGYEGTRGIRNADWAIGISANTKHPEEAFKLIEFLVTKATNQKLSSTANGFPGNKNATPDWVNNSNPRYAEAFEIFQRSALTNEFNAIPNSDNIGERIATQVQKIFTGELTPQQAAAEAQKSVMEVWQ